MKPIQRFGACVLLSALLVGSAVADATISVKDAEGEPVEDALVCIGTATQGDIYGQGTTDHTGHALISTALPEPPATVYITASKGGYGGQSVVQLSSSIAPNNLFATVQLGDAPGGPACPSDTFTPGIEVSLQELMEGELLQLQFFLMRDRRPFPPPGPVTFRLESSDPRLVNLPRSVTLRKGETRAHLDVQVGRDVRRATTVTLRAHLDGHRLPPAEVRVRIRPRDTRSGGRQ